MPGIPEREKLDDGHEFKANLGCTERPCLKKKKEKKKERKKEGRKERRQKKSKPKKMGENVIYTCYIWFFCINSQLVLSIIHI